MLAAAPGALLSLRPGVALPFAAGRIQGGVGASDQMEAVTGDPGVRERRPDGLALGVGGIDGDDLDAGAHLVGQRGQPALDDPALTARRHLDHPTAIQV